MKTLMLCTMGASRFVSYKLMRHIRSCGCGGDAGTTRLLVQWKQPGAGGGAKSLAEELSGDRVRVRARAFPWSILDNMSSSTS